MVGLSFPCSRSRAVGNDIVVPWEKRILNIVSGSLEQVAWRLASRAVLSRTAPLALPPPDIQIRDTVRLAPSDTTDKKTRLRA